MRAGIRAAILLVAAAVLAAAAEPAHAERKIHAWTLADGTGGLLVEDHRVPLVHVVLEFPVGSWSPWARENAAGDAFRIQFHDPGGELRSRADRLAMEVSLFMADDHADVTLSCLREDLEAALDLVRDIFGNRDFDRALLKRWKRMRSLEMANSEKSPGFRLVRESKRLLFDPGDPRRRPWEEPPPGSTDTDRLARVRDTILALPGRLVGFAGDLAPAEAERLAEGILPPLVAEAPPGLEPVLGPVHACGPENDRSVPLPRLTQVYFHYVRPSLSRDDQDYPASQVATHVLGGHFYSRLYMALRHEGGETYGARAFRMGGEAEDLYALSTFTRAGNAAVAEEKLRRVLEAFHRDGITEQERAAAVGYLAGRRPFTLQSPDQLLNRILWERRNGYERGFADDLVDRAAALSLDEINEFIHRFHDPSNFTMVKVVPK